MIFIICLINQIVFYERVSSGNSFCEIQEIFTYDIPISYSNPIYIGLSPSNLLSICILKLESHFFHDKIRQCIDEAKELREEEWRLPSCSDRTA